MMNFNESLSKKVAYNNIKSHQKSGLHPLSRKHDFEKWQELGVQMDPSVFLRLTPISSYVMVNKMLPLFKKD